MGPCWLFSRSMIIAEHVPVGTKGSRDKPCQCSLHSKMQHGGLQESWQLTPRVKFAYADAQTSMTGGGGEPWKSLMPIAFTITWHGQAKSSEKLDRLLDHVTLELKEWMLDLTTCNMLPLCWHCWNGACFPILLTSISKV